MVDGQQLLPQTVSPRSTESQDQTWLEEWLESKEPLESGSLLSLAETKSARIELLVVPISIYFPVSTS